MALSFVNKRGERKQVEPHFIDGNDGRGCDLCDLKATIHDERFYAPVYYLFGISFCDEHEELAKKAVECWLHKNDKVMIDWQATIPKEIASLLYVLNTANKAGGFKIRRSDGTIEEGWHWKKTIGDEPIFIRKTKTTGLWTVPTVNPISQLERPTSISDLKDLGVIPADVADAALAVLDAGVYRDSYNEVETELQDQLGL
jgi:hypothetical protein